MTGKEKNGMSSDDWHTGLLKRNHLGGFPDGSSIAQSLALVGDKTASPPMPLQVLLDFDLQTKVSSSDVEDDSPSGNSSSTTSTAAFLAAATTLGLSILI